MKASLALMVLLVSCSKAAPNSEAHDQVAATAKPVDPAREASSSGWTDLDPSAALEPALASFAKGAAEAGKKPYVFLHADWCGPCRAIEKTHATDAQMIDAFSGTAIARLDIDAAKPAALSALGLSAHAIPVFYKLDAAGKPTGEKIDGGAWGDNIPANMAPPLKAFFAK